uniref:Uncharacterized protein n=1 Tax=Arundo donax TaxID=35708 RepID=A0A0A9FFE1_ARUDO
MQWNMNYVQTRKLALTRPVATYVHNKKVRKGKQKEFYRAAVLMHNIYILLPPVKYLVFWTRSGQIFRTLTINNF